MDPLVVGRYSVGEKIASGGMATLHLGRLLGAVGFTRTVAIKRLHPHLAQDPEFTTMFLDEARLAASVHHPNVVPTLDVVQAEGELFLVMEYVRGQTMLALMRHARESHEPIPMPIAASLMTGVLQGLHAAHVATNESGAPLGIVHRDVSPQNVLVGFDGVPRLLDFGVARALGQIHTTREGYVKGKPSYMAPEQLLGGTIGPHTDIFAAATVLWELVTSRRLFSGESHGEIVRKVIDGAIVAPSRIDPELPTGIDDIVLRGLARDPAQRFNSADEMAAALEAVVRPATTRDTSAWFWDRHAEILERRGLASGPRASVPRANVPPAPNTMVGIGQTPDEAVREFDADARAADRSSATEEAAHAVSSRAPAERDVFEPSVRARLTDADIELDDDDTTRPAEAADGARLEPSTETTGPLPTVPGRATILDAPPSTMDVSSEGPPSMSDIADTQIDTDLPVVSPWRNSKSRPIWIAAAAAAVLLVGLGAWKLATIGTTDDSGARTRASIEADDPKSGAAARTETPSHDDPARDTPPATALPVDPPVPLATSTPLAPATGVSIDPEASPASTGGSESGSQVSTSKSKVAATKSEKPAATNKTANTTTASKSTKATKTTKSTKSTTKKPSRSSLYSRD